MTGQRSLWRVFFAFLTLLILVLSSMCGVQCDGEDDFSNPAVLQLFTQLLDRRITNLTTSISSEFQRRSDFCVKNAKDDWDLAFNFSSNLGFLASCIKTTKGDVMRRLCSKYEIKFYFSDFFDGDSDRIQYVKPNKNCNRTIWVPGCEPGWACALMPKVDADLYNAKDIPARTWNCQPCCEGFFCPHGLTCMIPCPLGAYCPTAALNKSTGVCDPYNYQLPYGQKNHSCGGANVWTDEIFCPAGSYCATTIKKSTCSSGHYCRMGSTSERPCNKLTSCHRNAAEQNMHVYGIMLILALSTLLIIIYNCYDQVLTTRERRLAKTREAAARSAREMARAREKWKSAKEIAKKHASQISRTISRSISTLHSGEMKHSGQVRSDSAALLQQTQHVSAKQPYVMPKEKKKGQDNLMKMMHDIEKDPENFEGFGVAIGERNVESSTVKGKEINTHSQIFRYAYAKIEKEKASEEQNKNLSFSRIVAMATSGELRKRPMVEVAFKDLTLTLKGKCKHILRCVTGNLIPGHITAVMGPSGAGKSTFLSALRGKTAEFDMTGSVFINGRAESIHSYRKIIGFVPQDDIVHGNLTVEENIWFSAKCRLSKDLPKADRFLIVERVIESLGLQDVRDSLVGTVENRGISGGQRKKVNVGLEMVMEPSLLILDEPTSGLDSSSSLLLLKALRRETLEGVNVCMVVHQPSYPLFRMFDDLMLLAKGGLTVYHGPVKMVEEYFASLGIHVPERINPPDHYIDFLEGIVKQCSSAAVCCEELPARWMLHKKYAVPQDIQHHETHPLSFPNLHHGRDAGGNCFLAELWKDLKCTVDVHFDHIRHNFLISKDLSNRETPGLLQQYKHFLSRICKQRLREVKIQAIDYLILLIAGASLGLLTKDSDRTFNASGYINTIIAMSLLCKVAALRSFSFDKLQYWRESASGMSSVAYFLSKDTTDHFNTIIKPVVYLSTFYFFNSPRSPFAVNYVILVCLVYCVTGMAYVLAVFLVPGLAQLVSVLSPVILALITTQPKDNQISKHLARFCYTTWASEAFMVSNSERYHGVWLIARCGVLLRSGYNVHNWGRCIAWMMLAGVVSRVIAFFRMVTSEKKV